jgi:hypothetical protein
MKVLEQVEAVIIKVEEYASTVTSVAAIAVSAVDPSQLPPKYAAIVVGVSNVTRVVDKYVPSLPAKTQKLYAEATSFLGHLRLNEKVTEQNIATAQQVASGTADQGKMADPVVGGTSA